MSTVDISAAIDALKFVEKNTGRPLAVSLNRLGKTFVIGAKGVKGAMQLTPKANKASISQVSDRDLRGFVVAKLKKAGQELTREAISEGIKKERARRKRAVGYTAYAGWSNAAKSFGGTGVKGVTASTKKLARFGSGHKATPASLVAELTNTAPAIEAIGYPAAQKALDNAAADQIVYAHKKMQELLDKVSA